MIFVIETAKTKIYFLDKEKAIKYQEENNKPYAEWVKKYLEFEVKWAGKQQEYQDNWKQLRNESDALKTGNIGYDSRIEDQIRQKYDDEKRYYSLFNDPKYLDERKLIQNAPEYFFYDEIIIEHIYDKNDES